MSLKLKYLKKKSVQFVLFAGVILTMVVISLVVRHYQLELLDEIISPEKARSVISAATEQQRIVHAWVTGTLDVIFPLLYGSLFVGAALSYYKSAGKFLAILVFVAVPCDLVEGVVQVLALTDTFDLLDLKIVITPIKMASFLFGWLVFFVGVVKSSVSHMTGRKV